MGTLLDGLGQLLNSAEKPVVETEQDEGPSSMDLAMQAAIEEHAAKKAARGDGGDEPRVTVVRSGKNGAGVFGRRGAAAE